MSKHKVADLAVKVGTYQKDGQAKNRYKNVGIVLQDDDGSKMRMIDPTFNFAAVRLDEGRDYVIISEFEVKDKQETAQKPAGQPNFDE